MSSKTLNKKQQEIYEPIISKFLINLPIQQRKQQSRISFHAEKAWYFYLDSVLQLKDDSQLKKDQRYQFFQKLRLYSPKFLNINPDIINSKLSENKPTCGAIILNQTATKVLVIRNKQQQLGFPKGKWNQAQRPEQCAAREVYEQIGIYLHTRIDSSQRIQFFNHEYVPSVFFVVKGVKQNQKLVIDKKQIQEVFWMNIGEVTRHQKKFVRKSRDAWKIFLQDFNEPKLTIDEFIEFYKQKKRTEQPKSSGSGKIIESGQRIEQNQKIQSQRQKETIKYKKLQFDENESLTKQDQNPFLSFKLDSKKLMSVFAK